jgi:hypothetical protein
MMAEYTIRDLWDKQKLDEKEHISKQIEKAEKDLLEGMTIVDGLNSEFWKLLRRDFVEPKLSNDRIDNASLEELPGIQSERRVLRDMLKYLEEKARSGNRAASFMRTLKQKEA